MDEAQALEALSNVLTALSENPYDISLHAQHINLAQAAGIEEQLHAAREMMTTYWAAGDEVWMPLIDAKLNTVDVDSVAGAEEVRELFDRAEDDYLSIPLLHRHVEFLISRHAHFASPDVMALEPETTYSTEWTRVELESVVSKSLKHMTEGHILWDLRRDWELGILQSVTSRETKKTLITLIDEMFLNRIKQPHSNYDETFQSYSTFTTAFRPATEYEGLLVEASKLRSKAAKGYEYREPYEAGLAKSNYSLAAYHDYVTYERRAKQPDFTILSGIFERAMAEAAKRRFAGEAGAEEALRSFWSGYIDALRIHKDSENNQLTVLQRALRSVPSSGEIWSKYIRFLEAYPELMDTGAAEQVSSAYDRAMATKLFAKDPDEIVPLVLARAGYEKRRLSTGEVEIEDALPVMFTVLEQGLQLVRSTSKTGDPRFRLEKFLVDLHKLYDNLDDAANVWANAAKHYKTSYTVVTAHADVLTLADHYSEADAVLARASTAPHMDWPEAIWEAWLALQHAHGSLDSLNKCLDTVERERVKVNAKRAREAQKASYQAMQVAAEQQATQVPVTTLPKASRTLAELPEAGMDVNERIGDQEGPSSLKRKAEDALSHEESKKVKPDTSGPLKRDRENCTVFVTDLPVNTSEDELSKLFRDCGSIREIKLTPLPNALVATVEFLDRSSVPAALTKDKKRLQGQEVSVHLAWQSTLYVTNFPEKADDASMRELFGKYGQLFDIRWPSKKYKNTRRFCYVQYTSPAAAKEALMLHGVELEPGLTLSVLISNPERKKERTDADADAREIYVAGLSKFATKEDLDKIFKTYGPVKDIRMALDPQGHSKGFAFVEFEEEKDAVMALNANNYELKKRRIAVTMADARVRSRKRESESGLGRKADTRSRSLRVRDLPSSTQDASTQEGLLQQTLEKYAPIKRVELFAGKNEAVVEFHSPADAAKLLLLPNPIEFHGNKLKLSDDVDASSSARSAASSGLFVPRNASSRPRAGLGHARKPTTPVPANASGSATVPPSASGTGPFQGGKASQDDFRKMLLGGN